MATRAGILKATLGVNTIGIKNRGLSQMTSFAIQRTGYTQGKATSAKDLFFTGSCWSQSLKEACPYTYEDAVSRVIILNVVDSANRYEVFGCEKKTSGAIVTPIDKELTTLLGRM